MKPYYEFVQTYLGATDCKNDQKYCSVGHTFYFNKEEIEGIYWFYETKDFIVDIHDFFIKRFYSKQLSKHELFYVFMFFLFNHGKRRKFQSLSNTVFQSSIYYGYR